MYGFCCSKYSLSKKLLFQIKYQPDFAYKSVSYKEARNVVLQSTKHGEVTLPREFIFVFISYFTGLISSEKMSKMGGGIGELIVPAYTPNLLVQIRQQKGPNNE